VATREQRVAEFITDDPPPASSPVELLCEDHRGTYVLPFQCSWINGGWHNTATGDPIEASVLGWRKAIQLQCDPAPRP
jgi:hypothetical protein